VKSDLDREVQLDKEVVELFRFLYLLTASVAIFAWALGSLIVALIAAFLLGIGLGLQFLRRIAFQDKRNHDV
jgi:hypothetical protein